MHTKIISGGQTGVDQAALQAATNSGLEHGGWCPPGRICEDGIIPDQFKLKETPQECDPSAPDIPRSQRTIWNVRDSGGVLVFKGTKALRDQGTELALDSAKELGKPYLVVNLNHSDGAYRSETVIVKEITAWVIENDIEILSVGGPSEMSYPGVYEKVYEFLILFFRAIKERNTIDPR